MPHGNLRFLLALMLLSAARAQAPDDLVLRITVNLVQVDAVVTDGSGRHVTDLQADDFEVRQNGKPQRVTSCSYVRTGLSPDSPAIAPAMRAPGGPVLAPRPAPLRQDRVLRTVALVVNDMGLSYEGIEQVRRALRNFVDVQMQPGDMVGVFRTLGTVGALQQFTNDKRQLHAAIDRIRWSIASRAADSSVNFVRDSIYVFATFDAVQSLARALKPLPGRKSLVLFSENLRTMPDIRAVQDSTEFQATSDGYQALVRNVADAASRSGVVIYTIDPRGLPTLSLTGAGTMSADAARLALSQTSKDYVASQSGLLTLASETGGLFLRETNDLNSSMQRILDDQQGYYLLGYRPDESTFTAKDNGRPRFHRVSIRVKRKGLSVRSYAGFTATADSQTTAAAPAGRAETMLTALLSPFGAPDIPLGMTATFYQDAQENLFLHTIVHIDAAGVTFQDAASGAHSTELEIATIMFGEQGREIDRNAWTSTARLSAAEYRMAMSSGFLQSFTIPVKTPGAFQLRVAVRDKVTGKVGSVGQFVDVPRIEKDRLALSGIRLEGSASDSHRESVLRVFHTGGTVTYGFQVLNAILDPASRKPQLEAGLRMYRDGKAFWERKAAPIEPGEQADMAHLLAGGNFRVGTSLTPGDYVMEVVVTDKLARGGARTATQSVDFQVAPQGK